MKFTPEDIQDPVLREIYTQEHEDAINKAAEEISLQVIEDLGTHSNQIRETYQKLNCHTGKSYVDMNLPYNVIITLIESLLQDSDEEGKVNIRDLLISDMEELIYGPPSEEEIAEMVRKNDEQGELCLNKENVADVLTRMSNAIKD